MESAHPTDDGVGQVLAGPVGYNHDGQAILTIYRGRWPGLCVGQREFYQIFVPENGVGDVEQCRFRGYSHGEPDFLIPEESEQPLQPESFRSAKGTDLSQYANLAGGSSVVDVMVAYTARAREARGGASGMLAHINQVFAESTAGLAHSQVAMTFRLVHAVEVSFDDTQSTMRSSSTLSALQKTDDGFLDEVHNLRDQSGADMVSLFVDPPLPNSGSFTVGMAYMLGNSPSNFGPYAFSVVHQGYAGGSSLTFPHEAGHNLGLNHDVDHGGKYGGLYIHSVGYQQKPLDPKFFTIMAYSADCGGCTPISYFSNPSDLFRIPVGITDVSDAAPWKKFGRGGCMEKCAHGNLFHALSSGSSSFGSAAARRALGSLRIRLFVVRYINAAWITGRRSGSGNGTVSLSIAENTSTSSRAER